MEGAGIEGANAVLDPEAAGWTRRRSNPFFDVVGTVWHKVEEGQFLFGMQCMPHMLNNAANMHGGAIMAFCDQALGGTLVETLGRDDGPEAPPARSVTVQLNVQFLAAVHPGDFLIGRFRVTRRTRSLVFLDGLAEVKGEAVASAQAVFKLLRPAV